MTLTAPLWYKRTAFFRELPDFTNVGCRAIPYGGFLVKEVS